MYLPGGDFFYAPRDGVMQSVIGGRRRGQIIQISRYDLFLRLGTGFRHARATSDFEVTIGDQTVPVLSYGALAGVPGRDLLSVRLPNSLIGAGETDLSIKVAGILSNVVRIHLGGTR